MSRIVVRYDGTRKPTINAVDLGSHFCDVYFAFDLDDFGKVRQVPAIRFGCRLSKGGLVIQEHLFPKPGVTYIQSDQKYLEVVRLNWIPNEEYTLEVFVREKGKGTFNKERTWITSKGTQPFPSWRWNDVTKIWDPPIPYPNDGKEYFWDEPSLSWIEVT